MVDRAELALESSCILVEVLVEPHDEDVAVVDGVAVLLPFVVVAVAVEHYVDTGVVVVGVLSRLLPN